MPKYLFYPAADRTQDEIWEYTVETWGEKQAEKYIRGLHTYLNKLATDRYSWRTIPSRLAVPADLDMQVHMGKYEHYYIFFRELDDDVIGIISILHEERDIPVRLGEDLRRIENYK